MSMTEADGERNNPTPFPADINLIRQCSTYMEEYKDCKRIQSRIEQYYTDGKLQDCETWLRDFNSCVAFREHNDITEMNKLLAIERQKKADRIKKVKDNNVWEYRQSPPKGWSEPLPDYAEIKKKKNQAAEQKLKEELLQKNKRAEEELRQEINK